MMFRRNRYRRQFRFGKLILSVLLIAGSVAGAWYRGWLPIEITEPNRITIDRNELAESRSPFGETTQTADDLTGELEVIRQTDERQADVVAIANTTTKPPRLFIPDSTLKPITSALQTGPLDDRVESSESIAAAETVTNSIPQKEANGEGTSPFVQTANEATQPANASSELQTLLKQIDEQMQAGNIVPAHRELSRIYWEKPEWREEIRERIETTARSIYFERQPHYIKPYVIQSGDQLRNIAKKYQVPWEYLARINQIDPRKIRADRQLKVIKGPFTALIDLSDFEMTIHAHGYFVRRYRVGIGKDGMTPIGTFTVQTKLVDPTYYGPDGNVIANDNPSNPLGERWIDIGDGYGIHGTIEPDSIGKAESKGCIRLMSSQIEEVYDLLGIGSQVVIQR